MIKVTISALLTMLITACTALTALLTQAGVDQFSDIPETAYASVALGALVAGANTWKASLAEPPKKKAA